MRKSVWIAIVILSQFAVHAQSEMGAIALKYPFLDTAQNHLEYFGSRAPMEQFYTKLDELLFEDRGKVNIVHIGGSHVQGGTLSHTLRVHLSQLSPEVMVERGFFFPHRLANTNMPGNISVKKLGTWEGCRNSISRNNCSWGFSGINAMTRDTEAGFVLRSHHTEQRAYKFSELRLFEHVPTNTMTPIITPSPDSLWLDSLNGVRRLFYRELQDSVAVSFEHDSDLAPLYTLQGVQFVREEPGIVYHALGVNGASTESFLRSENFVEQGRYVSPDLVIFGLGINDAYKSKSAWHPEEYKLRYDTLVQWFQTINPECTFIFMTNNDSYYRRKAPNENALDVVQVMKRLSKEHDAAIWDLFGVMGGLGSIALWEDAALAKSDKIHFTNLGYQLNSDLLFWALWEDYERHLKNLPKW